MQPGGQVRLTPQAVAVFQSPWGLSQVLAVPGFQVSSLGSITPALQSVVNPLRLVAPETRGNLSTLVDRFDRAYLAHDMSEAEAALRDLALVLERVHPASFSTAVLNVHRFAATPDLSPLGQLVPMPAAGSLGTLFVNRGIALSYQNNVTVATDLLTQGYHAALAEADLDTAIRAAQRLSEIHPHHPLRIHFERILGFLFEEKSEVNPAFKPTDLLDSADHWAKADEPLIACHKALQAADILHQLEGHSGMTIVALQKAARYSAQAQDYRFLETIISLAKEIANSEPVHNSNKVDALILLAQIFLSRLHLPLEALAYLNQTENLGRNREQGAVIDRETGEIANVLESSQRLRIP